MAGIFTKFGDKLDKAIESAKDSFESAKDTANEKIEVLNYLKDVSGESFDIYSCDDKKVKEAVNLKEALKFLEAAGILVRN